MEIEKWLNGNQLSIDIWKKKYQFEGEDFSSWLDRVSGGDPDVRRLIEEKKFLFGGRVLANRGLEEYGRKVSLNNCYVLQGPEDNIESIFDTAKNMARTFSFGGGVGIDISRLAPEGAKINNAAKTTSGAVSFGDLYDITTNLIGSGARRAALILTMSCDHPDIEKFITVKSDLKKLNRTNISVKITDEFMQKVINNEQHTLSFTRSSGETISKTIDANVLFDKFVKNNFDNAEPGMAYWNRVTSWHLLSDNSDYKLESFNPCGEKGLPINGACALGSFNLLEYIEDGEFDFDSFVADIPIVVKAMNDVLDAGIPMHPLAEQKEVVSKWRSIGIGIFSLGNMFIKLGIRYGSDESIQLSKQIASTLLNEAVKSSALLAKEYGSFPGYNEDALFKSKFFIENITEDVKKLVKMYGLRNGELLSIAPTGSLSSLMCGVSGGIEPLFATSYTRRTESLHGESVSYKVYDPTVLEIMKELNIADENDLPDYVITSQEIPYMERIAMQAAWQQYIDASISSTINLPNSATVEDIKNIYIEAWKAGLKGVTVYRAGCAREGILTTGDSTPASASELKRGDWKPIADDTIYPKIKLKTGCGELMLFPGWSDSEQTFQEIWIKKIGSGGCERSIEAIAIEASAIFRLGGNLYNIEKAFKKLETCPAFTNARKAGKRLSRGNSCADCILKALQKFEAEKKKESIELVNDSEEGTPASIESKNTCPDCGADLIATGGCVNCISCGYSKCS